LSNGTVGMKDLKTDKKVIVLASHSHIDHFNPLIFEWQSLNKDITYILGNDIKVRNSNINYISVTPYDEIQIESIKIKAFGSTDIGVSFFVNTGEVSIFHAGDLNWWYWMDDTTDEIESMERQFKLEISRIKGLIVDIAFFPVDPRLRHNYFIGPEYFVNEINPRVFVPMHFGNKYSITKTFAEKMKTHSTKVIEINHRGQEFNL